MVVFLKIVLKTISAYHLSIHLSSISLHIYRSYLSIFYLSIEIGKKSMKRQFTEEEIEKASKYMRHAQFHW